MSTMLDSVIVYFSRIKHQNHQVQPPPPASARFVCVCLKLISLVSVSVDIVNDPVRKNTTRGKHLKNNI